MVKKYLPILKQGKKLVKRFSEDQEWSGLVIRNMITDIKFGEEGATSVSLKRLGKATATVHFHPLTSVSRANAPRGIVTPSPQDLQSFENQCTSDLPCRHFIFAEDGAYIWDNWKHKYVTFSGREV